MHRALLHNGTFLAGVAAVLVVFRHALAHYAEVVQPRLHAVVRAAADAYLELVRQLHAVPAEVELVVDAVGEGLRVRKAVYAHCALAGHDRAHHAARAARHQPAGLDSGDQRLDVLVRHALYLHRQAGGHGYAPVAVLPGGVGERAELRV